MRTLDGFTQEKVAIPPIDLAADTPLTTAKLIDATGYKRARFVFSFGALSGDGNISSGIKIWNASTSGATFTSMAGAVLAAISSGAISGYEAIIDCAITDGKPWLQVSGLSAISSDVPLACTVQLYDGTRTNPPTQAATQVVVV